jgi:hypothetical protein
MARLATGGMLAWASIGKIQDPELFASQVGAYQIVGPATAGVMAVVLPLMELLVGLCLICSVARLGAGLLAVFLFSIFLVARSSIYFRGLEVTCGCGLGAGDGKIDGVSVTVSSGLLCLSVLSYLLSFPPKSSQLSVVRPGEQSEALKRAAVGSDQIVSGVQS